MTSPRQGAATAPPLSFEALLDQEILRSEMLRASLVAAIAGAFTLNFAIAWLFLQEVSAALAGKPVPLGAPLLGSALLLAFELFAYWDIRRFLRSGRQAPQALRYLGSAVEITIPSLAIWYITSILSPAMALLSPPGLIYFFFITLSTLRLDFRLSLFTGLLAAAQYLALALWLLEPDPALPPIMQSMVHFGTRVVFLAVAGLLAGAVGHQLRKRVRDAHQTMVERQKVLELFGQHVSPAVVERLMHQPTASETRDVCVMFLDIRGFTTFSEGRQPAEVVAYLNALFGHLIDIVNAHQGIINKFLGDGFMAVFGAPVDVGAGEASRHAVAAAHAILAKVDALVATGAIPPTRVGIGLHAGEAVTGSVGSEHRKEYTIIGDVVNLASRIEGLNKAYGSQLLVSQVVFEQLGAQGTQPLTSEQVTVKGRTAPIQIYQLV